MQSVLMSPLMDEVLAYRKGNTELLEVLMLTCCQRPEAEARVRQVLADAGMLTAAGPNWAALEARKSACWGWAEVLTLMVDDHAERERLLAMMDDPLPPAAVADLQRAVEMLVSAARSRGVVLTAELRPLTPLAMGHDETVVTVRSR